MALGVGAAVFTGYGVAWADDSPSSDAGPKATNHHAGSGSGASQNGSRAQKTKTSGGSNGGSSQGNSAQIDQVDNTVRANTFTGVAPSATASPKGSTTQLITPVGSGAPVAPTTSARVPAKTTASVSGLVTAAATALVDPISGGSPAAPVDSPLSYALLALSRRPGSPAAATNSAAVTTTSSLVSANALPVNTSLVLADGIITGDPSTGLVGTYTYTYTVANAPSAGGKITFLTNPVTSGSFTYLPDVSVLTSGTETFGIRVSQVTQFDQFLTGIPILGLIASPVIGILQQLPILSTVFAPIIGESTVAAYTANPSFLNAGHPSDPLAFTAKVTSFDGTLISTNYYPASTTAVLPGTPAPTILNGPGLGYAGATNPFETFSTAVISNLVPGIKTLRDEGYNVITWDPRGEFASGGVLQLDSPAFEGQDVKSLISWSVGDTNPGGIANPYPLKAETDSGDPVVGMVGGSYGGAIQLVAAGIDPRIDAIAPAIAWNSLPASLYPNSSFKTSYASLLLLSLITTGASINNQIYLGIGTGDLIGWLSQTSLAVLGNSGPDYVVGNITAPTLFFQGTSDVLFPLQQALANSGQLASGVPQKTVWFCGGHGPCLNATTPTQQQLQNNIILQDTLAWLNKYVKGSATPLNIPNFQWVDQNGDFYNSGLGAMAKLPTDTGFNNGAVMGAASGGLLGIVPLLGGSGPSPNVSLPYSLGLAAPAPNAINVAIDATGSTKYIAGAPTVTFDYQGLGTSRFVYAQIVDKNTDLVVGNLVTPIPVTLDGRSHSITVPVPLAYIAYTYGTGDSLELQITSSATAFENFTAFGVVNISNVKVSIPTVDPTNVNPQNAPIT